MRTRSPLLAVVVSAGLVGLCLTAPARADSSEVVRSYADMKATRAGFLQTSCSVPGDEQRRHLPAPRAKPGPGPVPLGNRVWRYDLDTKGVAVGPYRHVSTMEDLSFARVQVHAGPDAHTTGVLVAAVVPDDTTEWHGLAPMTVTQSDGWTYVPITGDVTFTWKKYRNDKPTARTFTGSYLDMIDHTGNTGAKGYAGVAFGCNGKKFSMDDAEIGDSDRVVTYDLEAPAGG